MGPTTKKDYDHGVDRGVATMRRAPNKSDIEWAKRRGVRDMSAFARGMTIGTVAKEQSVAAGFDRLAFALTLADAPVGAIKVGNVSLTKHQMMTFSFPMTEPDSKGKVLHTERMSWQKASDLGWDLLKKHYKGRNSPLAKAAYPDLDARAKRGR